MKICRFTLASDQHERPRLGLLGEDGIRDVTAAANVLPDLRWPLPPGDQMIAHLPEVRARIAELASSAQFVARENARLLSPIANPGKFVCGVGNWKHQGAPLGMLGFLYKVTSAAAGESEGVRLAWPERTTVYEAELGIVIGRTCKDIGEAEAAEYIAGYCCALDMTMKEEREFLSFCKSFDTYGVLGPCLVTADEIAEPAALSYSFSLNGAVVSARSFSDLTGNAAQLVTFASRSMTLHPGDVVFSGAADIGPVAAGDVMHMAIAGIGEMTVRVH